MIIEDAERQIDRLFASRHRELILARYVQAGISHPKILNAQGIRLANGEIEKDEQREGFEPSLLLCLVMARSTIDG